MKTEVEKAGVTLRKVAGYGWRPDTPDIRDHLMAVEPPRKIAPVVSLRSKMPQPYDQGQLGSCTANAIAGALEFERKRQKQRGVKTSSRLFIYYGERVIEGSVQEDSGAEIRDGIKVVAKLGAPNESDWPYDISRFAEKPPKKAFTDALKHQALAYARVPQTVTALQSVLASGFPVIFGFTVYSAFESSEVASTGVVPMPTPNDTVEGGHAVLLVGYKTNPDGSVTFEVRNSWGTDWGDSGYFWMPASYVTSPSLASDFWVIRSVE